MLLERSRGQIFQKGAFVSLYLMSLTAFSTSTIPEKNLKTL
jgi:hypothetical protein